ncbi:MAG: hypothetical protein HY587_02070 [Candidatus Omnitrophica bacterium]|nr:hypothetical protein [Candidatus Omnitrophota bacterium]
MFRRPNEAGLFQDFHDRFGSDFIQVDPISGVASKVKGFHKVSVSNQCLNDNHQTNGLEDYCGDKMEGVLSYHSVESGPHDFSFMSRSIGVQNG